MGHKGPYILLGRLLIPGLNLIVQSQAVNWATVGLLAGPPAVLAGIPSGPAQTEHLGPLTGPVGGSAPSM